MLGGACRYVCLEGRQAMHMKGTLVRQAASSTYKLTEARLGGRLTRQDVNIAQVGHLRVGAPCAVSTGFEALFRLMLGGSWVGMVAGCRQTSCWDVLGKAMHLFNSQRQLWRHTQLTCWYLYAYSTGHRPCRTFRTRYRRARQK